MEEPDLLGGAVDVEHTLSIIQHADVCVAYTLSLQF